jgi:hypothetical protein
LWKHFSDNELPFDEVNRGEGNEPGIRDIDAGLYFLKGGQKNEE